MNKLGKLMSTTAGLVALYLVLVNWFGATKLAGSFATAYIGAVKALQGR